MSKQTVMSHDPLADLAGKEPGEAVQQPGDAPGKAESKSDEAFSEGVDLVLESSLTIADVGDYHAVLNACLEGGKPIRIDAGGLDAVDGAGLQLLAAFIKNADAKALAVSWVAVSDALSAAAQRLGVVQAMQLPGAPSNG